MELYIGSRFISSIFMLDLDLFQSRRALTSNARAFKTESPYEKLLFSLKREIYFSKLTWESGYYINSELLIPVYPSSSGNSCLKFHNKSYPVFCCENNTNLKKKRQRETEREKGIERKYFPFNIRMPDIWAQSYLNHWHSSILV